MTIPLRRKSGISGMKDLDMEEILVAPIRDTEVDYPVTVEIMDTLL